MTPPRATMRLQFHKDFTFDDAAGLAPYLAQLNVSHVYASPITTARAGSIHGYDVVDPSRVNPELGGEEGFCRLVGVLRQAGLGIIVDIVPNHMAVGGTDNEWWLDVLEHGRASRYAGFFDIDWDAEDPALRGKVLLPILGRPYGEALQEGEISLAADGDRPAIRYFSHLLPIAPDGVADIGRCPAGGFDATRVDGRRRLHDLLERQHYRLAWWRTANDEINWRRFFDVNELAALRADDDEVFEATHALILRLYAEGSIDGVRVDHVDGLTDPGGYCRRLRSRLDALQGHRPGALAAQRAYLIVEKILGPDEQLPADWLCDGTSGYAFMEQVSQLFHDPRGEDPLGRLWATVSGRPRIFAEEEEASRRELLDRSFSAQLGAAVASLHRVARADLATRDISRAAIRRCLTEILAHLRVYRIYAGVDRRSEADAAHLGQAVEGARQTSLRADRDILEHVAAWVGGDPVAADARPLHAVAMTRFQQLSAPLAAKAVEDTAFYRHGLLLSQTDVGFDAGKFSDGIGAFHRKMRTRHDLYPGAMLATATHDHKRGEDVRARLAVLSEHAADWSQTIEGWMTRSAALRRSVDGAAAPSSGDVAILLQMMVGAWPPELAAEDRDACRAFADRLARWQEKALREAKLATDWAAPNEPYETAARDFLYELFADRPSTGLIYEIAAFAHRLAPAGAVNGLTQVLIKLTAPGVPDIYQGTEFWDFSLVDPDNRRPVDFAARTDALTTAASFAELAKSWRDGRIKQRVIRCALAVRRASPLLFAEGDYAAVRVIGPLADHVVAYVRQCDEMIAVTVATRLAGRLLGPDDRIAVAESVWGDTTIHLPTGMPKTGLHDALGSDRLPDRGDRLLVSEILRDGPVALLVPGEPVTPRLPTVDRRSAGGPD